MTDHLNITAQVVKREKEGKKKKNKTKTEQRKRSQKEGLRALRGGDSVQADTVCSDNWLKVSKPPGAGMCEGRSLLLLKSVPRILKQTGCLSAAT